MKNVKEKLFQNLSSNECPINIFDPITFELEMNNLNDTFSRFKFSSLFHENFGQM